MYTIINFHIEFDEIISEMGSLVHEFVSVMRGIQRMFWKWNLWRLMGRLFVAYEDYVSRKINKNFIENRY